MVPEYVKKENKSSTSFDDRTGCLAKNFPSSSSRKIDILLSQYVSIQFFLIGISWLLETPETVF